MKIELFNKEELGFELEKYLPKIEEAFSESTTSTINVVFVSSEYIHSLNKEYRNVDSVTDVLSFNIDGKELLGEIYICPEYVKANHPELTFHIEILRLIIHGILHLLGYDHKVELNDETKDKEVMFVKQEKILENVL